MSDELPPAERQRLMREWLELDPCFYGPSWKATLAKTDDYTVRECVHGKQFIEFMARGPSQFCERSVRVLLEPGTTDYDRAYQHFSSMAADELAERRLGR